MNPPFTDYGGLQGHGGKAAPLNLAYLASYLMKIKPGVSVTILDCEGLRLKYEDIEARLRGIQPDIIGITMPTPAFLQGIETARMAKRLNKDVVIVAGGPHPTAFPIETLGEASIDITVYGEGEITFTEIVQALEADKPLSDVKGIAYKDKDGNARINAPQPLIADLDSIPFPSRDLLPLEIYFPPPTKRESNKPSGNMITSRGCPYECTYCMARIIWDKKVRLRGVANVVNEIEECAAKYGLGEFNFHDELFTLNRQRTIDICREIQRRKLDISWVCMVRVDYVWEDVLIEMKKAGCKKVMFGFESGAQEILDIMKKKTTIRQAIDAVKLVKRLGIKAGGNFMFGNIGETEETIRKSIELAKRLNTDTMAFFIASPYPGTEFYDTAKSKGYLRGDLQWKDFTLVADNPNPPLNLPGLSSQRIAYWQKRAYREYYLRLGYVLQKISGIRSKVDIKNLIDGARILLRL